MLDVNMLEDHIKHHDLKTIKLKCLLRGNDKIYYVGQEIRAEINKLSNVCHTIEVNQEIFGVFCDWYEVVI
jgi:hypothetical protein